MRPGGAGRSSAMAPLFGSGDACDGGSWLRTRGVLRVLVEACFKTLDPLLLGGQLLPELRDQSKAGSVNVVLLFPRLHLSIEHGNGEIDSSEMNMTCELSASGGAAHYAPLITLILVACGASEATARGQLEHRQSKQPAQGIARRSCCAH